MEATFAELDISLPYQDAELVRVSMKALKLYEASLGDELGFLDLSVEDICMVLSFKPLKILLPRLAQTGMPSFVGAIKREKQATLNAKHAAAHVERVLEVVFAL